MIINAFVFPNAAETFIKMLSNVTSALAHIDFKITVEITYFINSLITAIKIPCSAGNALEDESCVFSFEMDIAFPVS